MSPNKTTLTARQQARQQFEAFLTSHGRRRTPERFAILDRVMETQGHFSAEKLYYIMKEGGYPVSAATVYSTLDLLVECGLAERQRFSRKAIVFEKACSASVHHHLICTECGKIKEIRDQGLTEAVYNQRFRGFQASKYSLEIYGVCAACMRHHKKGSKAEPSDSNSNQSLTNQ